MSKETIKCEDCKLPVPKAVMGKIGPDMVVIKGKYWHATCFMAGLTWTGYVDEHGNHVMYDKDK